MGIKLSPPGSRDRVGTPAAITEFSGTVQLRTTDQGHPTDLIRLLTTVLMLSP